MGINQLAFLLNIPTIVIMLLLIAYPLGYAFYLSVHQVTMSTLRSGNPPFVGLQNYLTVLSDPLFLTTLGRTLLMGAISVFLMLAIGLFVALGMNMKNTRLSWVTRALVLIPWAVPPVANGLMWSFIFNSRYGHLNAALYSLGLIDDFIRFLSSPTLAFAAVVLAYVWRVMPFSALLYHAALAGIPKEIYEAAEVDGASAWQKFWHITLPLLRPVTAVLLILRTAFALMIFDEVFALTSGGPGDSTWTAAWYSYWTTFRLIRFDTGSASAFILAVVIGIFAWVYVKFIYRRMEE
ncbi:MAG: sugar ABC transporter permease [Deltaproteobacteria bacterium]|nr:sugar ABC transporter permease [Deltaproteobacteria bacterium]